MADLRDAACKGVSPEVFDHHRFPAAQEGLDICAGCPIVEMCGEHVRPSKTSFDGVAAGKVWRNGYQVRPNNTTREDRLVRQRINDSNRPRTA